MSSVAVVIGALRVKLKENFRNRIFISKRFEKLGIQCIAKLLISLSALFFLKRKSVGMTCNKVHSAAILHMSEEYFTYTELIIEQGSKEHFASVRIWSKFDSTVVTDIEDLTRVVI